MRKQILQPHPAPAPPTPAELDIPTLATAFVTSEKTDHPIENAFDARWGPGGSRWIAETEGEQILILEFDRPQALRQVLIEVEELEISRTQELQLAISTDAGKTYREIVRQEYNFSPPQTTFEREAWTLSVDAVTQVRLSIKPDKGGRPVRASLTRLALL